MITFRTFVAHIESCMPWPWNDRMEDNMIILQRIPVPARLSLLNTTSTQLNIIPQGAHAWREMRCERFECYRPERYVNNAVHVYNTAVFPCTGCDVLPSFSYFPCKPWIVQVQLLAHF